MNLDDALSVEAVVTKLGDLGAKTSERELRAKARRLGAFCEGSRGRMFFMPYHLERLMEPEKKCSNSPNGKTPRTGSPGGQSKTDELSAARARLQNPKLRSV